MHSPKILHHSSGRGGGKKISCVLLASVPRNFLILPPPLRKILKPRLLNKQILDCFAYSVKEKNLAIKMYYSSLAYTFIQFIWCGYGRIICSKHLQKRSFKFNTQEVKNPFVKVLKSSTVINVRIPNKILQVQSYINQRISYIFNYN